ncbi:multidrug transporter EmrE-like cation transporter [Microbacterium natoriense]|uniref:Multidrug transporter EmrE-like cation transporter n=1 Tax=Microbacterium natoriense TaxID=284570 RepID=A0AAW8ESR9_9MICO|nr:hypothetical protein [Microbacterium natoriense]MDQ0645894.1 multidrug transporter EmrE-like cation transporter [Microbacterium natoriense]
MTAPGFFDARPLVDPVDNAEVARFARAQRTSQASGAQVAMYIILGVLLAFFVLPIIYVMAMGLGYAIARGTGAAVAALVATVFTGGLVTLAVIAAQRGRAARELASYRLSGFAAANSMEYFAKLDAPPLPGMIYSHGTSRMSTDVVRGTTPRFVEFGNYQYTTSNGKNSTTHRWGYVAIKLDVPLPHIVLDALSDNTLGSDVAAGFSREQRLSLEGDFDRYFSLFCPSGYEVDALYLFAPDVMARFIDNLAQLNVEIVDDWMFFYTRRPVSTLDPATWSWLFGAVGAMMTKLDQWARWRDDRLRAMAQPVVATPSAAASALPFAPPAALLTPPPPGVAPPGQRLRTRSPWLIITILLVVAGGMALLPFAFAVIAVLFAR